LHLPYILFTSEKIYLQPVTIIHLISFVIPFPSSLFTLIFLKSTHSSSCLLLVSAIFFLSLPSWALKYSLSFVAQAFLLSSIMESNFNPDPVPCAPVKKFKNCVKPINIKFDNRYKEYSTIRPKKYWPDAIKSIYMIWPLAECNIKFYMIRPVFFFDQQIFFGQNTEVLKFLNSDICRIV